MPEAVTIKQYLHLRKKEDVEVVIWDFKGKEGNFHGDGNIW